MCHVHRRISMFATKIQVILISIVFLAKNQMFTMCMRFMGQPLTEFD
jgi:hypothetical protein